MRVDAREEFAREIALRALDRAPRSRAQLAARLASKDVAPEVAEAVLDRLEEVGLVNDQALADMLVRTRHSERGLVGLALVRELTRKGIDDDAAAAAMAQVTPEDEAAAAEQVARKRLAVTRGLPRATRLRRVAGVLARKGYPPGMAYSTVRRLLEEESESA
ncbi:MAG: recombination regulator RecX [Bifidobacteriaceae bacterium]|jgi:regulatory protein|nr:recombination regulator RecX [Bifidobacteriaceae bacterium]